MAEGLIELNQNSLQTTDGINELNRMLRFLFDNIAGDGLTRKIFSGYGSPETIVSADIGSLYMRFDGGATTSLYVKTSGTAATGWTNK